MGITTGGERVVVERRYSLAEAVQECVSISIETYTGVPDRKPLKEVGVVLVGDLHRDLVAQAFMERGIAPVNGDNLSEEEKRGRHIVDLNKYFEVYRVP